MAVASVIVPIYNVEKYIRESLETVLTQTCTDIEIILVDDGSTDGSGRICDDIAEKDARVRVVHQANGGVGSARNAGLDLACGKYIYFCDPDDFLDSGLLEDNIALAEEHGADMVFFAHKIRQKNTETCCIPKMAGVFSRPEFGEHLSECIMYSLTVWTRLFRREFLVENGLRFNDQKIGEDAVFNLQALGKDFRRVILNPQAYYHHVIRSGSAMTQYNPDIFDYEYHVARTLEETADSFGQGKYQALVDFFYIRAVIITLGVMSEENCPLTRKMKKQKLKEFLSDPRIKQALSDIDLSYFKNKGQRLKALLLKMRLYGLVIYLGEKKKRLNKQ